MALVPVLAILVTYGYFGWALVVFVVAGLTDILDGLVARLRKEKTRLGILLDPLADKALVATSLVVLSLPSSDLTVRFPAWLVILAIGRDAGIVVTALVISLAVGSRVFPPSVWGKLTTGVQLATILWVFWCNFRGAAGLLTEVLFGAMAALTIASALHYMWSVRLLIGEDGSLPPDQEKPNLSRK